MHSSAKRAVCGASFGGIRYYIFQEEVIIMIDYCHYTTTTTMTSMYEKIVYGNTSGALFLLVILAEQFISASHQKLSQREKELYVLAHYSSKRYYKMYVVLQKLQCLLQVHKLTHKFHLPHSIGKRNENPFN